LQVMAARIGMIERRFAFHYTRLVSGLLLTSLFYGFFSGCRWGKPQFRKHKMRGEIKIAKKVINLYYIRLITHDN